MAQVKFFKLFGGAVGVPLFFIADDGGGSRRPEWDTPGAPIFFSFTAAKGSGFLSGRQRRRGTTKATGVSRV